MGRCLKTRDGIASFNSTLPTRFKSLSDVQRISGKSLVLNAARLYDFPLSASADYFSTQRHCFYLVRTQAKSEAAVKISLVEGSFFETLPKEQLLAQVWEQILGTCGLAPTERAHIVELLSGLEQSEIARSRDIKHASIRPRLRLMAEVHRDARLHSYPEIKPRTVNLVIKREHNFNETWLHREFAKEGILTQVVTEDDKKFLLLGGVGRDRRTIKLCYFVITHRSNGEHIVVQYALR